VSADRRIDIFLIEDDPDLRESLIDLLEFEGYIVEWAVDGAEGLQKLGAMNTKPKVILVDWMMPVMDGAQFCARKKQTPDIANIPLVMLTADHDVHKRAKMVGADLGVAKPLDVGTLLAAIQKFLNQ
jgi:two-component system, OmpR family, response regulator MprA